MVAGGEPAFALRALFPPLAALDNLMGTTFDTPFDRFMRAHRIRPLELARKAKVSRPTVFRARKGSVGRAGTRAKLVAACSAFVKRRVTEVELFGYQMQP